jgi:hypothetical protein
MTFYFCFRFLQSGHHKTRLLERSYRERPTGTVRYHLKFEYLPYLTMCKFLLFWFFYLNNHRTRYIYILYKQWHWSALVSVWIRIPDQDPAVYFNANPGLAISPHRNLKFYTSSFPFFRNSIFISCDFIEEVPINFVRSKTHVKIQAQGIRISVEKMFLFPSDIKIRIRIRFVFTDPDSRAKSMRTGSGTLHKCRRCF